MTKRLELTEQRFGMLVALEFERTVSGRSGWRVRCDCGDEFVVETSNLRKQVRSCRSCYCVRLGDLLREDLTGQKFGKLTALQWHRVDDHTVEKNIRWICVCECGDKHEVTAQNLKSGRTSACRKCGIKARAKKQIRNIKGPIPTTYWNRCIEGAAVRNLPFLISPDEAHEKYLEQKGRCAISGVLIGFRDRGTSHKHTASLDRIDSRLAYTKDNIQWVHVTINLMKNRIPETDFLSWCRLVCAYQEVSG